MQPSPFLTLIFIFHIIRSICNRFRIIFRKNNKLGPNPNCVKNNFFKFLSRFQQFLIRSLIRQNLSSRYRANGLTLRHDIFSECLVEFLGCLDFGHIGIYNIDIYFILVYRYDVELFKKKWLLQYLLLFGENIRGNGFSGQQFLVSNFSEQ